MTKKDTLLSEITEGKGSVISQFANIHGEEFIVYTLSSSNYYYVSGDKLDWEYGWHFDNSPTLKQEFLLGNDEYKAVREITTNNR